jgi:hypothetical protein
MLHSANCSETTSMFKRLRIAVLLYVLLFVAAAQFFAARRSTDWDQTLWVDVYPVNGDGRESTRRYLDNLDAAEFTAIEQFFSTEAQRYGVEPSPPFRLSLAPRYEEPLPDLARASSLLGTIWWSLEMRWLAAKLDWTSDRPSPDIMVFAVFHDSAESAVLDRSTALRKGLITVTNLFADRAARGPNQVVLAHELLHTLGATDKYGGPESLPQFPDGFADPEARPRLPQSKAELMGGRIPIDEHRAEIPAGLRQVVIGPTTAREIGWLRD